MKKVKLVKKALLPAVIAVCCSLLALTSVSYAWFTLGNTASVNQIDVNVKAADGIQISADAKEWMSILPVDKLKDSSLTSNFFPSAELYPMSSVGEVDENGKQEMFFGEVGTDGKQLVATKQAEGDEKAYYIAFDLYVNLAVGKEFYLDEGASVVALTGNDKHTEYAVRVSFINLGTAAASADAPALKTQVGDTIIWEPNSTSHISEVKTSGKLAYNGVNGEGTIADKDASNALLSAVNTIDPAGAAEKLFYLGAGYTKLRVYIWLEGQDADCLNDISGGGFSVNLAFKTLDCTNHTYTDGKCSQCGAEEPAGE